MKTLMELDSSKINNFDAIRFFAATLVIFSHAYAVSGHPGDEPLAGTSSFITFGGLAVEIFFVISGYLVTQSLLKRDNLTVFVEARFLRIFPALIACCFLSALVLGPIATSLPVMQYLANIQTWHYLIGNASLTDLQWFLPNVFDNNILKGVINGSLWTLPAELKMYGLVFACGLLTLPLKSQRHNLIGVAALGYVIHIFATQTTMLSNHLQAEPKLLIVLFLIGMIFYVWRSMVPISATLALLLWGVLLLSRGTPIAVPLYYLSLAYSIVVIAFDENLRLNHFAKRGDFSYGLYLYAFPVKQVIVLVVGTMSSVSLFLIAFPATLMMAWLSWHFVESPALKRKGQTVLFLEKMRSHFLTTR